MADDLPRRIEFEIIPPDPIEVIFNITNSIPCFNSQNGIVNVTSISNAIEPLEWTLLDEEFNNTFSNEVT